MASKREPETDAQDRRVRRSRSALMRAAVALVSERGTTTVSLSEIAEAADVSRQVVYQQFGDRDALLVEAALDLAQRELIREIAEVSDASTEMTGRARTLAMAQHFAQHRAFYRALMTGSCAFGLNKALDGLLLPTNRKVAEAVCGEGLDARTAEDIATFVTGGGAAFFNAWVVNGEEPLDPEQFTERVMRMLSVIGSGLRRRAALTPDSEDAG